MQEARRMQAADLFEQGVRQVQVARLLGVPRQAVGQWHAAWREGGRGALVARANGSRSYLTPQQERELLRELRLGASARGWEGQGWTLSRIARVIEEKFGVRFSVPGVWYLMDRQRHGCLPGYSRGRAPASRGRPSADPVLPPPARAVQRPSPEWHATGACPVTDPLRPHVAPQPFP
ncbi:helix-turn-helix domain-containing protein [Streptomyces sp. NBC_01614]|uniref:helix-turn-helix domain-containing protein n=1 Tax=Streptomyces sp. NBC_01614 TaxID=2975897 RepID=UPI0038636391